MPDEGTAPATPATSGGSASSTAPSTPTSDSPPKGASTATAGASTAGTQEPTPSPSKTVNSLIRRLLGREPVNVDGADEGGANASKEPTTERSTAKSATNGTTASATEATKESAAKLELTAEELDRRVQAEADRREAKRQADDAKARRRELRRQDPEQYAAEDEAHEAQEQQVEHVRAIIGRVTGGFDTQVLAPLLNALPDGTRDTVVADAGTGIEGRAEIVKRALTALEKHWKAEGAKEAGQKLRENPTFRKDLLREFRSTRAVESDLAPGQTGEGAPADMNAWMRAQTGRAPVGTRATAN